MLFLLIVAAAAATSVPTATPTAAPTSTLSAPTPLPRPASVAIVWHLAPAPYPDKNVRQAFVAMAAVDALASPLAALRDHPRARFSLAIDTDALENLTAAAAGGGALTAMADGKLVPGDLRSADLMRVLAQVPVLDPRLAATPAARRYEALAAAAPLALAGQRAARFSAADYVDFAGFASLIRVAAAGALAAHSPLLAKTSLTTAEATAIVAQLAKLDANLLDLLKRERAGGQLELLADPAREPILPLLTDSGGSSGPYAVALGAGADAVFAVNQSLRESSISPDVPSGVYSPHGAYDDRAAEVIARARAAFALFSDRVLRASPIGGSREAVSGADVAAYQAYGLKTVSATLPVLFWDEDDSLILSALSPRLPAGAMGGHVRDLAKRAGGRGAPSILVLRIEADGLWNRRADRARVVGQLAAALSSGEITSTTIGAFLGSGPIGSISYGFSPGSDAGALTYWMGNQNQRSMWAALADARKAAGGDAALDRVATRAPLLEAEASHWYLAPTLVAPLADVERLIAQFRLVVFDIYRGAGKPIPNLIAPVKLELAAPPQNPVRQP